jgi:hypothetical protein
MQMRRKAVNAAMTMMREDRGRAAARVEIWRIMLASLDMPRTGWNRATWLIRW